MEEKLDNFVKYVKDNLELRVGDIDREYQATEHSQDRQPVGDFSIFRGTAIGHVASSTAPCVSGAIGEI
jgi:hypothetical protein